jgi:hypothetical protein
MRKGKPTPAKQQAKQVGTGALLTVKRWDGRRLMGNLSPKIVSLLPIKLDTDEVGMTYETNEHLLKERDGQIYAAGHVFESIPDILADPDYYWCRHKAADGSSVEFELWKQMPALGRWVKACFKGLKAAKTASGKDEIWVSTGWSFPSERTVKRALKAGRLVQVG